METRFATKWAFRFKLGFEPTYKEWKCKPNWANFVTSRSFEPTYEGWKHESVFFPGELQESFKPTYEGWKRQGRLKGNLR